MMNVRNDIPAFIAACCAGSQAHWNQFFEIFHPLIAGTVRQMTGEDTEDIVQAVYFKLIDENYRLLRQFRGESFYELLAYLRQISVNTAANFRRSQGLHRARMTSIDEFVETLATPDNPEARYLNTETSAEIQAAVMRLDIKYREPVHLLIQGFKHREIAEILQLPIDTVSTRIRRAYEKLEKDLKDLVAE